jgi:hypothetical protein
MLFTMNGCMCMDAIVCICTLGLDGENPKSGHLILFSENPSEFRIINKICLDAK